MPSSLHETLIEIFRVRSGLVATLLGGPLGQVVPRFERARVEPGELTDVAPTEYREIYEEGREEGRQEGLRLTILMLRQRFGDDGRV